MLCNKQSYITILHIVVKILVRNLTLPRHKQCALNKKVSTFFKTQFFIYLGLDIINIHNSRTHANKLEHYFKNY